MGLAADLDRTQRRTPVLGFPIAVFYKYFDDQGNYLSAIITYYAFIAIFPLLLLSTSILGFFLQNDPGLASRLLTSALSQFPIVGDALATPQGLRGSYVGVAVGGATALYGSLGLGQALQNALNVAWAVPRNKRPNPIGARLRSLALLAVGGISVLAITIVSTIGTNTEVFGTGLDDSIRWLIRLATIALLGGVLTLIFRLAAARRHHLGRAAPGAFVVAVLWQGLQYLGTIYAQRVIGETGKANGTFALVLGLIGIIFLAAIMGVLGIEVNVVLARRLWPRSLASVFTDNDNLTEADLRAYAGYVKSQQHKKVETVEVTFLDPSTGALRIPQEALRKAERKLAEHVEAEQTRAEQTRSEQVQAERGDAAPSASAPQATPSTTNGETAERPPETVAIAIPRRRQRRPATETVEDDAAGRFEVPDAPEALEQPEVRR